jgi:hypothetical protein
MCVVLSCNCQVCKCEVYHQSCVEKYLKTHKLEYNRKTGFQCPRGYSKCTASAERCHGKIEKSHPIIPRKDSKPKVGGREGCLWIFACLCALPQRGRSVATLAPSLQSPHETTTKNNNQKTTNQNNKPKP